MRTMPAFSSSSPTPTTSVGIPPTTSGSSCARAPSVTTTMRCRPPRERRRSAARATAPARSPSTSRTAPVAIAACRRRGSRSRGATTRASRPPSITMASAPGDSCETTFCAARFAWSIRVVAPAAPPTRVPIAALVSSTTATWSPSIVPPRVEGRARARASATRARISRSSGSSGTSLRNGCFARRSRCADAQSHVEETRCRRRLILRM